MKTSNLNSFFRIIQKMFGLYEFPPFVLLLFLSLFFIPLSTQAQEDTSYQAADLKKMSLEELMSIEVTSVSKKPEKLSEVASAIQVITQEDIRRSGATCVPEALRLAPNLQVAQLSASAWIISARGFNAAFSNKLLVMIDGRTVYSPLFAGVFWDVQNVLLEDVERIEVISGPGGTLWGANAVNGIINIITKSSKDTKGLYASAATGNFMKDFVSIRFGGKIDSTFSYRAFFQQQDYNNTTLVPNGNENHDQWGFVQGGFRTDWQASKSNALMLQGNLYESTQQTAPEKSITNGQNALARWTHDFSEKSSLTLQGYFDRTWRRDVPSTIKDQLETYDIDLQHRFALGKHHRIIWGAGYRFMQDKTENSTIYVGLIPANRDMNLYSGFLQYELSVFRNRIKFTIGGKVQDYTFSGSSFLPSARLAWTPNERHTLWTACSYAIRAPSRIDVDYYLPTFPLPPTIPHVEGGPNFTSEKVTACEIGYRVQPATNLSLSLAMFYNKYDDLYSVEALPGTQVYQIQNGTEGYSDGIEFSGRYQPFKRWKLRGGYTYFHKELRNKPNRTYDYSALGNDPQDQFLLQSILDLPWHFQADITARYAGSRPNPYIVDYFTFDARLAWIFRQFELSVVGQNLWQEKHTEYSTTYIPQKFYAKLTCRF
ncbi:MAG: TonB-dependent receptor [Chitinophagaceae bacterium]|nr:TonB-dependent receptor [Chitinophagaceae bacterium]